MKTPKKILLATRPLTPPWDEASKNFAYFLAKSITSLEFEIHTLTTQKPLEGLSANSIQHPIYTQTDFSHAGYPLSQKLQLAKYLFTKSQAYDIVHYLFTPTTLTSTLITHLTYRRPKSIQTIATLREDLYTPDQWKKMFFADKLVVYSDYSKKKLEDAGFTGVQRIYPGIDLTLYSPKQKSEDALKYFNLTHDDFIVMYPGEYVRLGATDMLVDMLVKYLKNDAGSIQQQNSNSEQHLEISASSSAGNTHPYPRSQSETPPVAKKNIIFIFGCRIKNEADQKKKDEVVAKLTQAGIIDNIRFTDTWKDMPALYNLSDVVVFPVENMRGKFDIPLAIIEPYACSKPVILSDLEIFQEFSKPEFSVTIPRNDGDALWRAIIDLRSDEAKKKALSINARAFVEQYFDLQNTARKYESLYEDLY